MTTIRQRNQGINPSLPATGPQETASIPSQSQNRAPTFSERAKRCFFSNSLFGGSSPEEIRAATKLAEERTKADLEYEGLEYEKIDSFPAGYPSLAAFMNSDESFIIFRRFGRLSTRLLLHLQTELVLLQKKLDALDNRDNADPIMHWRLRGGTNFKGYDEEHLELLEEIRKAYLNYAEVLEKDVALRRLDKATTRDHRSLFNWVRTMNPFCGDSNKAEFITRFEDFVSLSQQSQSTRRFEDLIQRLLGDGPPSRLKSILQDRKVRKKTNEPMVTIYSPARLAFVAKCLSSFLVAVILLIPVYLLFLIEMSRAMMAVVTSVFVLAFVVIMSAVTDAQVHEIFVGAAAYGAVLLVFLDSINNQTSVCRD